MSATFEGKVIDELCMHWAQRFTEATEITAPVDFPQLVPNPCYPATPWTARHTR
jgi:hypothetical protein